MIKTLCMCLAWFMSESHRVRRDTARRRSLHCIGNRLSQHGNYSPHLLQYTPYWTCLTQGSLFVSEVCQNLQIKPCNRFQQMTALNLLPADWINESHLREHNSLRECYPRAFVRKFVAKPHFKWLSLSPITLVWMFSVLKLWSEECWRHNQTAESFQTRQSSSCIPLYHDELWLKSSRGMGWYFVCMGL